MRTKLLIAFILFSCAYFRANAQCNTSEEMNANGTISKTTNKEIIYTNNTYTMFSQVKFDGYEYFFIWSVSPFETKAIKTGSMEVLLDNEVTIKLEYFDSYGLKADSSVNVMYKVNDSCLKEMSTHNINSIRVETEDGVKNFILVEHKDLVKQQIACMIAAVKKED